MKRIDENHSFNINVCQALQGHIQKAIILKEIYGWCHINQTKGHNLKNGLYWTFMSARAFHEKFPYMNKKSISRWLKELETEGFIFSGKFNKVGFDRTKWYTINFEQYDNMVLTKLISKDQIEKWIDQIEKCNTQDEVTIPSHTTPTTQTPNFKKNIKKENSKSDQWEIDLGLTGEIVPNPLKAEKEKKEKVPPKRKKLEFDWPDIFLKTPELKTAFEDFIQMRKEIKKPYK